MSLRLRNAEEVHSRTVAALIEQLIFYFGSMGDPMTHDETLAAMASNLREYVEALQGARPGQHGSWLRHHLAARWEEAVETHAALEEEHYRMLYKRALSAGALEADLVQETLARLGVAFLLDALRPTDGLLELINEQKSIDYVLELQMAAKGGPILCDARI